MPRTNAVADHVIAVAQTDSTNALARRMLRDGELTLPADGVGMTVVAADEQTAGRGRLGRTWVSQPGASMTCSFVAALPMSVLTDADVNGWLTMIAGLAALDALRGTLEECGLKPNAPDCTLALKWPNDIYCHGLKLGGILTEFVPLDDTAQAANTAEAPRAALIIGIGVNLHLRADRLPTPSSTSLQLHVDNLPDTSVLRDMICARIASSLRNRLYAFARDPHAQAAAVHDEALRVCWTISRRVEARFTDGTTLAGTAVALNADASLQVRDDAGELHTVHTADVGVL
ncbi:biotin--[acetyl-CoA-carboxylase] ligase [Bifidobacterium goeldii]|uniref:Biotin--[acetyl-CoA-carboxylase] ligase n=1 Tax=Bifidobacterium goeldii TaxID=2306975 RepID=A0A430FDC0_9BIFI|nr:biotin--[acetyl-CoA-carboxylase] ligase [Bifidobacterium goeldii]RSX50791.1 biotin--[acetyl-CoA-carboxylase] ligase [Bifidobacterium goeldii]